MYRFEVKVRLNNGRVSFVEVRANDSGHARQIVEAQFNGRATVMYTKRLP